MIYGIMCIITDVRVYKLYVKELDHGTVCGLIMESQSLATTSALFITWIQRSGQRTTINMTPDTNLIPLAFPHDGIYVTTDLYPLDPSVRFLIHVTHSLEHGIEGLIGSIQYRDWATPSLLCKSPVDIILI